MRIRSLGVIGEAVLPLGPGLTVVTGETGAGKTMVVTGLSLLLGARADAGAVRAGNGSAVVEGRWILDPEGPVAERAREAGAELDDDHSVIVARSVSAEGRSRAHLGGRSVPVGVLSEIAPELVAVHGQADQQRLQSPARQRELIDRYAGAAVADLLAPYGEAYRRLREVEADLLDIRAHSRERAQEAERLRQALEQIEAVDPQPGEDARLAAELARLIHADTLRAGAGTAHDALRGDADATETGRPGDAAALVAQARHALDGAADLDPSLGDLGTRLRELAILLDDIAGDLASYLASVDADPARLGAAQERLAELRGLTRLYGEDTDAVLAWAQQASLRLLDLEGGDQRIADLEAERDSLRARLADLAARLGAARRVAGDRLSALAGTELAALAMPHASLGVSLSQRPDPDGLDIGGDGPVAYGPTGVDEVELLLSPHAGAPARPLGRGASGGELSRVMLALEVVIAGADPVPTFVFDEVDAGVGGRAAVEIGARLARLAQTAQVLVVTHLPQVAAYADQHLVVSKADDGVVTESGVVRLDRDGRIQELARMLAGQEDSASAQAHAEELLDQAGTGRG